jgi:hypothetical protein
MASNTVQAALLYCACDHECAKSPMKLNKKWSGAFMVCFFHLGVAVVPTVTFHTVPSCGPPMRRFPRFNRDGAVRRSWGVTVFGLALTAWTGDHFAASLNVGCGRRS